MVITTGDYVKSGEAPEPAARPQRRGAGRQARPEGQWALGQTDPLNHNEEFKREDNPLNVRARIIDTYSNHNGFPHSEDDQMYLLLLTQLRHPEHHRHPERGGCFISDRQVRAPVHQVLL